MQLPPVHVARASVTPRPPRRGGDRNGVVSTCRLGEVIREVAVRGLALGAQVPSFGVDSNDGSGLQERGAEPGSREQGLDVVAGPIGACSRTGVTFRAGVGGRPAADLSLIHI